MTKLHFWHYKFYFIEIITNFIQHLKTILLRLLLSFKSDLLIFLVNELPYHLFTCAPSLLEHHAYHLKKSMFLRNKIQLRNNCPSQQSARRQQWCQHFTSSPKHLSKDIKRNYLAQSDSDRTRRGIRRGSKGRNLRYLDLLLDVDVGEGRRAWLVPVHAALTQRPAQGLGGQLPLSHHLQFSCPVPLVHRAEFVPAAPHPICSYSCK